jgi:hypothetical protein
VKELSGIGMGHGCNLLRGAVRNHLPSPITFNTALELRYWGK